MSASELDTIETQVEQLITAWHQVQTENSRLHHNLSLLTSKHAKLLAQKEKTMLLLKKTIKQLKTELASWQTRKK